MGEIQPCHLFRIPYLVPMIAPATPYHPFFRVAAALLALLLAVLNPAFGRCGTEHACGPAQDACCAPACADSDVCCADEAGAEPAPDDAAGKNAADPDRSEKKGSSDEEPSGTCNSPGCWGCGPGATVPVDAAAQGPFRASLPLFSPFCESPSSASLPPPDHPPRIVRS